MPLHTITYHTMTDELRDRLAAAEQRISELERLQTWVPPDVCDSLDALKQRISELEANSTPTDVEYRMLLRGGSWYGHPRDCRSASRGRFQPGIADNDVGFRVVCLPQGNHTIRLEETDG